MTHSTYLLVIFTTYLIGSLPIGYWYCRYFYNVDITKMGSGNSGATNASRIAGPFGFFVVFFFDVAKAYTALFLVNYYIPGADFEVIASICLLVGNAFSPFLFFKGGKGVATASGIFLYLLPAFAVGTLAAVWLLIRLLAGRVDIASLVTATGGVAFVAYAVPSLPLQHRAFLFFVACWIVWRHADNIARLVSSGSSK